MGGRNAEGESLLDFYLRNAVVVRYTLHKKRESINFTRYSVDGEHASLIDDVLMIKCLQQNLIA